MGSHNGSNGTTLDPLFFGWTLFLCTWPFQIMNIIFVFIFINEQNINIFSQ